MKRKFIHLLLVFALLCTSAIHIFAEEKQNLIILHTNDVHGAIEYYAEIKALKDDYEEKGYEVYLFDAGDYIQGTPALSNSKGKVAIELMNLVGYDAVSLGNHEFDYGYDVLMEVTAEANFNILSPLNFTYEGKSFFDQHFIFEFSGHKIGVFSLSTPETATKAHPNRIGGFEFKGGEDMIEIAQNEVDALKNEGCDFIICIGHLGIDDESAPNRSIDVVEAVSDIDLFIDGHSHSTLTEIEEALGSHQINETVLTSTGTKLEYVGVIEIDEDLNMSISSIPLSELSEKDTTVQAYADQIQKEVDEEYGKVFAQSEVYLNGERDPGNRTEETNLGDLSADSLLWAAQMIDPKVDAAIANGGGIRASINKGDITKKDITSVFPYFNCLAYATLTGAQLLEALEASTYSLPVALGGFPQVAGIVYEVDVAKEYDAGELYPDTTYYRPNSINRVTIESVNGEAFDLNGEYTIAVSDFMAGGGDTYYVFKEAKELIYTGLLVDEVLMNYIAEGLNGLVSEEDYGAPKGHITILNAERKHIVSKGDCLWNIALSYYGNGTYWKEIYNANKSLIIDPSIIISGQELIIPNI